MSCYRYSANCNFLNGKAQSKKDEKELMELPRQGIAHSLVWSGNRKKDKLPIWKVVSLQRVIRAKFQSIWYFAVYLLGSQEHGFVQI